MEVKRSPPQRKGREVIVYNPDSVGLPVMWPPPPEPICNNNW